MSLRIQRSEWFIGDLEHYAAWYDREASWEVAERYLRSDSPRCPAQAIRLSFRQQNCEGCDAGQSSDHSRST